MTFEVLWSHSFRTQLARLPKQDQDRIIAKVEESARHDARGFVRLVGSPQWRLRVGPYRVLATKDDAIRLLLLVRVDQRKRIYR